MNSSLYRIPAITALVLGISIVIYGLYEMANSTRAPNAQSVSIVNDAPGPAEIVVAAHPIGRGKLVGKEDINLIPAPRVLPAGAVMSAESVVKHYAVEDIAQ